MPTCVASKPPSAGSLLATGRRSSSARFSGCRHPKPRTSWESRKRPWKRGSVVHALSCAPRSPRRPANPCRRRSPSSVPAAVASFRVSWRRSSVGGNHATMEGPVSMNRIDDYAIIGDCRSAALVSRQGSVDWLCWPRFDSPSIFGALLDESAGRWSLAPVAPFRTRRGYLENTNVLQTRFETSAGSLLLTDLMPVASEGDKRRFLFPEHEILRILECESGQVEVEMVFDPRPGYGRDKVRIHDAGGLGLRMNTPAGLLTLRTDFSASSADQRQIHTRAVLHEGDVRYFSLTLAEDWQGVLPP